MRVQVRTPVLKAARPAACGTIRGSHHDALLQAFWLVLVSLTLRVS